MVTLLSGCGTTTRPYLDVGVGYKIDHNSDWYLRTEREWTCDSPFRAHFEAGLEFPNDFSIGYHHWSNWACGGPFNKKPELYEDSIMFNKRFGGIR